MIQNLNDIKALEQNLRSQMIDIYSTSEHSVRELGKRVGMPYTSFRGFMLGSKVSTKSLFKIKIWLETIKQPSL